MSDYTTIKKGLEEIKEHVEGTKELTTHTITIEDTDSSTTYSDVLLTFNTEE